MPQGESGTIGDVGVSSNVLITGTPTDLRRTCATRLGATDSDRNGIVVTFGTSAEAWLTEVQPAIDTTILSVGEPTRSTTAVNASSVDDMITPQGEPHIDGIADPTDLASLGLKIHDHLDRYGDPGDGETILSIDSINGLLDTVSLPQAFRFLHIVTALISRYHATAHYHLEPGLDPDSVETIRVLFDEAIPIETPDEP